MGKPAASKVTIGYQYYLSMHLALCHGPVDSIDQIKAGPVAQIGGGKDTGTWTSDSSSEAAIAAYSAANPIAYIELTPVLRTASQGVFLTEGYYRWTEELINGIWVPNYTSWDENTSSFITGAAPPDFVIRGAEKAWPITENGVFTVNQPQLFGGKFKEGGVVGDIAVRMGAPDQQPDEWLRGAISKLVVTDPVTGAPITGAVELPAFRGVTCLIWKDIWYSSNSASPKPWQVQATRIPYKDRPYANINGEANPAYIIAECLLNPVWGLGYSLTDIDVEGFTAAAKTLFDEGFGLSAIWEEASTTEDFIGVIVQHCSAMLYVNPSTGQFTLRLIRNDYNIETSFVADESNIVSLENFARAGMSDLVNQLTIQWVDVNTSEWRSLTVHNPAVREIQKSIVAVTRQYVAVTSATLAKTIAIRDLSTLSQPLASVKLTLNRTASKLSIGDVFLWNWPDLGIEGMILRVASVAYGSLDAGTITLECIEDLFGANHVNYTMPGGTEWVDPHQNAAAAPHQLSVNPTYLDVLDRLTQAGKTLSDLTPNRGITALLASQPSAMFTSYELWCDGASTGYTYRKIATFNPYGQIAALVRPEDYSTFTVINSLSPNWIKVGQYAVCNGEWMYVDVVRINSATNVVTVSCFRGIADTSPGFLYAETDIWFYDNAQSLDYTDYLTGSIVRSKALPRTPSGLLPIASAPASENTIDARWMRPYPPANLRINGSRYPVSVTGDVELTWAHRNRLLQEDIILHQNEASVSAPEIGTTYTIRIFSGTGTVLNTIEGLISASYIYTAAQILADGAGTNFYVAVVAVRDGLVSYGAHFSLVSLSSSSNQFTLSFPSFGTYNPLIPTLADHIEITSVNTVGIHGLGFSGQDAQIYWEDNHVALFATGTKFSLEAQADWFDSYQVIILKNGVVRRTVYTTEPKFTYTYAMNTEDGLTRSFEVTVCVKDAFGNLSPTRGLNASNPAPEFTNITFKAKASQGTLLVHARCTDPALISTKVYASKAQGFIPSTANLAYQGADLSLSVPTPGGGVWYIRLEGIDDFGEFGAIMSEEYTPDVTPPRPCTMLTTQSMFKAVLLRWINPSDIDFDHVDVFMGPEQDFFAGVGASKIGTTKSDSYLVLNLPTGSVVSYFWIKAVDTSGNESILNAVTGTAGRTLDDAAVMVDMLAENIGSSALNLELGTRINLIDAASTGLVSLVGDHTASIALVQNVAQGTVESIAQLQSTVGANTTAVEVAQSSVDGINAKYTVKIDSNGYVSGYGLMSEMNTVTNTPLSSFAIRADKFSIGTPSVPGSDGGADCPFMVTTTPTTIDGTVFPAGAYIKNAFITKLTANQIDSRGLTIRDAAGNVILGSGTGLDWGNVVNPPTSYPLSANDQSILDSAAALAAAATTAATAATDTAVKVNAALVNILSDGILSVSELQTIRSFWDTLIAEKPSIQAQITTYNLTSQGLTYTNAITQLGNFLNSGVLTSVAWASGTLPHYITDVYISTVTNIGLTVGDATGTSFRAAVRVFENARTAIFQAIADLSVTAANLAVTNSIKPPDWFKLVNAPTFGGFAYLDSITTANISTYIKGAVIGTAYISDAAITSAKIGAAEVNTLQIAGDAVTVAGYVQVPADGAQAALTMWLDDGARVVIKCSAQSRVNHSGQAGNQTQYISIYMGATANGKQLVNRAILFAGNDQGACSNSGCSVATVVSGSGWYVINSVIQGLQWWSSTIEVIGVRT